MMEMIQTKVDRTHTCLKIKKTEFVQHEPWITFHWKFQHQATKSSQRFLNITPSKSQVFYLQTNWSFKTGFKTAWFPTNNKWQWSSLRIVGLKRSKTIYKIIDFFDPPVRRQFLKAERAPKKS